MNDDIEYGSLEEKPKRAPGKPLRWHEVWLAAYTRPATATFEAILADPTAKPSRAYMWVLVTATLSALAADLALVINGGASGLQQTPLCTLPLVGILSVVFLIIGAGFLHIIAKLFGGRGRFDDMIYASGAVTAANAVVVAAFGLMSLSPGLRSVISLCLGLYGFLLSALILKAVHGFGTGRAWLVALTPLLLFACGVVCIFTLYGQQINAVFQDVLVTLQAMTAVPH